MKGGWLIIVALVSLSGCGASSARKFTEADYDRLGVADVNSRNAIQRADQLERRVADLEDQVADLTEQLDSLRNFAISTSSFALSTSKAHDSLVTTFNGNVDKRNAEAIRGMTQRGACGQEWVEYSNGARVWSNKECTLEDLR